MSDVVVVAGSFDDMRFADFRFLEEASKLGKVHVALLSDESAGRPVKFPLAEREYLLRSIRYVSDLTIVNGECEIPRGTRIVREGEAAPREARVIPDSLLKQPPPAPPTPINPPSRSGKKVIVTGCFDYFHSGHVRFLEECSELGDLYVAVGNDANVRELKGEGHPLFPALQRRMIVGSIRYVTMCIIGSGMGWMDAEPDIDKLKPDIYAVNEDGDKPEKREFCREHGLEYRVLKRLPKPGLTRRSSTDLRGF